MKASELLEEVRENRERLSSDIESFTQWMKSFEMTDEDDIVKYYKGICKQRLCDMSWNAIVEFMDNDIREIIANEINTYNADSDVTLEEFFALYAAEHYKQFGEEWELAKENPTI